MVKKYLCGDAGRQKEKKTKKTELMKDFQKMSQEERKIIL